MKKRTGRRVAAFFTSMLLILSIVGDMMYNAGLDNMFGVRADENDLYFREADASTMDSYVEASLGGYRYVNGKPILVDNSGTRYAGEVWADKSVYAAGQSVGDGSSDGSFDGHSLTLGKYTDGIDAVIPMDEAADFLEVFSALGSSEVVSDGMLIPLDVVFVLDASGSMCDGDTKYHATAGTELYEAYLTDEFGNYLDEDRNVTEDLDKRVVTHVNTNSRFEFSAESLNQAFETLMEDPDNRVALVTYNKGAQEVLPLGRYEPTEVIRSDRNPDGSIKEGGKVYSEGYHDGELRYFTAAKDGIDWSERGSGDVPGIGDERFAGVESFNQLMRLDGSGYDWSGVYDPSKNKGSTVYGEWPMIEVNARPEGGGDIILDNGLEYPYSTEWNGDTLYYIKTALFTDTAQALTWSMQQILAKEEDTTVTRYLDKNGNLTWNKNNAVSEVEVNRHPVVILLTDGRANDNMVSLNEDWWDTDTELSFSTQTDMKSVYGEMAPTYIAATTSLWKDIVNTNYYGNPDGTVADGNFVSTDIYTFGLCLVKAGQYGDVSGGGYGDVDVEINTKPWAFGGPPENLNGEYAEAYYASLAYMHQDYNWGIVDTSDLERWYATIINVSENHVRINNRIVEILKWSEGKDSCKTFEEHMGIEFAKLYEDENSDPKLAARILYDVLLACLGDLDNLRSLYEARDTSEYNISRSVGSLEEINAAPDDYKADMLAWLIRRYPAERRAFMGSSSDNADFRDRIDKIVTTFLKLKNIDEAENFAQVEKAAHDYFALQQRGIQMLDKIKATSALSRMPVGSFHVSAGGRVDPETGVFIKGTGQDIRFEGEGYKPTSITDMNWTDESTMVLDPKDLPRAFNDILIRLTQGSPYNVLDGSNSAGIDDSLTYSDPVGKYMHVDSVTDIALFGAHYKVSPILESASYEEAADYIVGGGRDDTSYTVYRISGRVTSEYTGAVSPVTAQSANRVNESTHTSFNLLDGIRIWVEKADGEETLYVNIRAEALPLQIATLIMDWGSDRTRDVLAYGTNLENYIASTPFRLFYNVSIDKDCLRYNEDDNGQQERSNAVAVDMMFLEQDYIDSYSAYFDRNGNSSYWDASSGKFIPYTKYDAGVEEYITFYSNLFTNNIYDEYPVVADENKTSRGDAKVMFSPSDDNQFYKFQKNRVLFAVPGSYDSDPDNVADRPAEIELGDLRNYYTGYANGVYTVSSRKQDGLHQVDIDNFDDLCAVLNAFRANTDWNGDGTITSNGNGNKSAYWAFGDCVPVDGSGSVPLAYESRVGQLSGDDKAEAESIKRRFDANLGRNDLPAQPQIASENWYYIIREYYAPVYENGLVADVELHYVAIARKGSEFGSGLANGGHMGEYVEWYMPGLDVGEVSTAPFDSSVANYGKPGDGWYVSAKPGGFRVGGMANFAGVKGYGIREGVADGKFTKDARIIADNNVTETAHTYFLPTVSHYKIENDIAIDMFLGNNGRIRFVSTTNQVVKSETSPGDKVLVSEGQRVDYTITFQNYLETPGTVTVQDRLDPGVNFLMAGFQGDRDVDDFVQLLFPQILNGMGPEALAEIYMNNPELFEAIPIMGTEQLQILADEIAADAELMNEVEFLGTDESGLRETDAEVVLEEDIEQDEEVVLYAEETDIEDDGVIVEDDAVEDDDTLADDDSLTEGDGSEAEEEHEEDVGYTVYYKDLADGSDIRSSTFVNRFPDGGILKGYELKKPNVTGYDYSHAEPEILTKGENNNEITLWYSRKTDLKYTVYYKDVDNKDGPDLIEPLVVEGMTFKDYVSFDTLTQPIIYGYSYNYTSGDGLTIGMGENKVYMYYKKINTLSYTISYVDALTGEQIANPTTVSKMTFNDVIPIDKVPKKQIDGYLYDHSDKDSLTIDMSGNEITLYYTRRTDLLYTVYYRDAFDDSDIQDPLVIDGNTLKDVIKADSIEKPQIEGYSFRDTDKAEFTINVSGNEITLWYTRRDDLSYKVYYKDESTGNDLLVPVTINGAVFKTKISINDIARPDIHGYAYRGADKQNFTVAIDGNEITLNYVEIDLSGYKGDEILHTIGTTMVTLIDWTGKAFESEVTISYNPETHTVEWAFTNVPAFYVGKVTLSVVVNDKADCAWDYAEDWSPETSGGQMPDDLDPKKSDYRIYNQARAQLNNEDWSYSNKTVNPTRPFKWEDDPGEGRTVMAGDVITYNITWLNDACIEAQTAYVLYNDEDAMLDGFGYGTEEYEAEIIQTVSENGLDTVSGNDIAPLSMDVADTLANVVPEPVTEREYVAADVHVSDYLDPGVDFVEAGFLKWDDLTGAYAEDTDSRCSVRYDAESHAVFWELPEREPKADGAVYIKVRVNETAMDYHQYDESTGRVTDDSLVYDSEIVDMAGISVDNGGSWLTNVVRNPVKEKPEDPDVSGGFWESKEPKTALTVMKTVGGNAGETNRAFKFTVVLSDTSITGDYGSMYFDAGRAEFTLKHGQSISAKGLPVGVGYEVIEESLEKEGYIVDATGTTGTFEQSVNGVAKFTNVKQIDNLTSPGTGSTGIWLLVGAGISSILAALWVLMRYKKA